MTWLRLVFAPAAALRFARSCVRSQPLRRRLRTQGIRAALLFESARLGASADLMMLGADEDIADFIVDSLAEDLGDELDPLDFHVLVKNYATGGASHV